MSTESPDRKQQENKFNKHVLMKKKWFFAIPFEEFVNGASLSELRRTLTKEEKQELKRILKEELVHLTKNKD